MKKIVTGPIKKDLKARNFDNLTIDLIINKINLYNIEVENYNKCYTNNIEFLTKLSDDILTILQTYSKQ